MSNKKYPIKPLDLLSIQERDELSNPNLMDEENQVHEDDLLPILDVSSARNNRTKKVRAGQLVNGVAGDLYSDRTLSNLSDYPTARDNLGLGSAATEDTSAFDPAGSASTAESNANNYTDSQVDTRLAKNNNLSDVVDAAEARENIEALGPDTSSSDIRNDSDLAGMTVSDALENTPGRVLLGEIILDEPYQGIIHFSDISQEFTSLVLEISARLVGTEQDVGNAFLRARMNSTSTSINSYGNIIRMQTFGVDMDVGISGSSSMAFGHMPTSDDPADRFSATTATFFNYATLPQASFLVSHTVPGASLRFLGGCNASASDPINALLIWAGGTSITSGREALAAGSQFRLWGVRGNPPVAALWGGL